MRSLFVCLLLGIVAWVASGPDSSAQALVTLGLLMALPAIAARLAPRYPQLTHVGPLAAGCVLAWSGLVPDRGFASAQPYVDLAAVWVGMHLGASLPTRLLRDRSVLLAVLTAAACPLIVCFTATTLLLDLPTGSGLLLALLSPLSAPLFVHLTQPHRKQALWLSVLMTCTGLLAWVVLVRPPGPVPPAGPDVAVALLVWAFGIEVVHRGASAVRSAPGQYLLQAGAALVLSVAAGRWGFPALFVGLASGLALSFRARRQPATVPASGPVAAVLTPLLLAATAGGLSVEVSRAALAAGGSLVLVYTVSVFVGKLAGILLAGRLTPIPLRDWLQTLPQGFPAAILVLASLPVPVLPEGVDRAAFAALFLLLPGLVLSLVSWPLQVLAVRLSSRRH